MTNTERIRELNDKFRNALRSGAPSGQVLLTPGITSLPDAKEIEVLMRVINYDDFNEDNDPHGEHDFGSFEIDGKTVFWKIDYYDIGLDFGSPNPADPDVTTRVLTIMLAEEY